jgi:hypothetical protein
MITLVSAYQARSCWFTLFINPQKIGAILANIAVIKLNIPTIIEQLSIVLPVSMIGICT